MAAENAPNEPKYFHHEQTSWRHWWPALAFLVLLAEQAAFAVNMMAPALPAIAGEFATTQVIWVITIFVLVGGATAPVVGKLGDRFGKKRVLMAIGVVALLGLLLSALAPNFLVLVVGRAISGVTIAFVPLTFAIIRDVFPERMQAFAIGVAANGVGVVTILGPFVAGALIATVGPRAIFLFVLALTVVGLIGVWFVVPDSDVRSRSRIDVLGAILLTAGLICVLTGVSEGSSWGWASIQTVGCIGLGCVLLAAWVAWELRIDEPLVDLRIVTSRAMGPTLLAAALISCQLMIVGSFVPSLLQTPRGAGGDYGFDLSTSEFALWAVPSGLLTVTIGLSLGTLARRVGFRAVLIVGVLVAQIGVVGLAVSRTEVAAVMILIFTVTSFASVVYSCVPGLLLAVAPAEQRGVVAGLSGTCQAVAGGIGAQIAGVVIAGQVVGFTAGAPVYALSGYVMVLLIASGCALLGVVVALRIPDDRPAKSMHSGVVVAEGRRRTGPNM